MKNSLNETGLSLTQAQSISNLINQRASEIGKKLNKINNSSKTIKVEGETYIVQEGVPMPKDVTSLITERGKLFATQAFLMENIKAKDQLLKELRNKQFTPTGITEPDRPKLQDYASRKEVNEQWGFDQLTVAEYNEYIDFQAQAAHIGDFIHSGSKLSELRNELPTIKTIDWMNVSVDRKTPIKVIPHHTSEDLLKLHEQLAGLHRKAQERTNYFLAKVKNLVTDENARLNKETEIENNKIITENDKKRVEYTNLISEYSNAYQKQADAFEVQREQDIKAIAALRIEVDARFQPIIDVFQKLLS